MKILIIGGTGFIGSHVTRIFIKNGHDVALFHRDKKMSDTDLNLTEIIGSRDKIISFKKKFYAFNPDMVIDTIAYTSQDIWSLQEALKDITDNFLLLSSGDVYKAYDIFHKNLENIDNSPLTETSELRNRLYPYKADHPEKYDELLFNYDKIIVEKLAQTIFINTCTLRLPAVFGKGDKQQKLSEYIIPMVTNQPSIILSTKKANWIWTRSYVENIAYAVYLAAINKKSKNEIFNIGDINLNELELVTKLKELSGWKGEIIIDDKIHETFNYAQNILLDNSKIKQVLNYAPIINEESALLKTIEAYS